MHINIKNYNVTANEQLINNNQSIKILNESFNKIKNYSNKINPDVYPTHSNIHNGYSDIPKPDNGYNNNNNKSYIHNNNNDNIEVNTFTDTDGLYMNTNTYNNESLPHRYNNPKQMQKVNDNTLVKDPFEFYNNYNNEQKEKEEEEEINDKNVKINRMQGKENIITNYEEHKDVLINDKTNINQNITVDKKRGYITNFLHKTFNKFVPNTNTYDEVITAKNGAQTGEGTINKTPDGNNLLNNNKTNINDLLNNIFEKYKQFEQIKENHKENITYTYPPPSIYKDNEITKNDLIIKFNCYKYENISLYLNYKTTTSPNLMETKTKTNKFPILPLQGLLTSENLKQLNLPPIPILPNLLPTQNIIPS
ncbi:hypothetical protein HEP_00499800, partial [Hepatocystis sp. ex Piliocolobus tephrosceles]